MVSNASLGNEKTNGVNEATLATSRLSLERSLVEGQPLVLFKHYLGRFHDDFHLVTFLQFKLFRAPPRDYAFDLVLTDANDDMGHNVAQVDFHNFPFELVPR